MIGMRRSDPPAGLVLVEQEGGEAAARIVRGARQQDEVLRAPSAPVMNHLRPWTTQRSPLRSVAVVSIIPAGSEPEPGAGSVMTIAERTLPSTIGCSQRSFCAGGADLVQHDHVAVVGCGAVAGHGAESRAPELLVDDGHADRTKPEAAARPRHLRAP